MDLEQNQEIFLEIDFAEEYIEDDEEMSTPNPSFQEEGIDSDWEPGEDEETLSNQHTEYDTECRVGGDIGVILKTYNDSLFQKYFRMPKGAFSKLLSLIEPQLQKKSHGPEQELSNAHQLLATIWLLTTKETYREVAIRFNITKTNLARSISRIITAVKNLSSTVITWPDEEERERNKKKFQAIGGLRDVIGVIDATYVPIRSPQNNRSVYMNEHTYCSITLQAICDAELRFIDCSVGHPSSIHNDKIFHNSRIFRLIEGNKSQYCPNNEVILADNSYTINTWCITPFKDKVFDLKCKRFNAIHTETRNVIERCFALFYGRWRRLQYLDMVNLKKMPITIMACCVIHNICLMFDDDNTEEYIRQGKNRAKDSRTINYETVLAKPPSQLVCERRNQMAREVYDLQFSEMKILTK